MYAAYFDIMLPKRYTSKQLPNVRQPKTIRPSIKINKTRKRWKKQKNDRTYSGGNSKGRTDGSGFSKELHSTIKAQGDLHRVRAQAPGFPAPEG